MKAFFTIIMILFFTLFLNAEELKKEYLFLGNHNIPPIVYKEGNKPAGLVVDLANAIAKEAGIDVKIEAMDWAKAQETVFNDKADALLQINSNPQRAKIYNFSEPLLKSEFCIFHKDTRIDIKNIVSLFGKTVAVENKGYPISLLKKYPKINIRIISSWKEGFELIEQNMVDALIVDRWVGEYVLSKNKIDGISIVDKPIECSYSAIAVKKENTELLNKINKGLQAVNDNGTREKILNNWSSKKVIYLTKEKYTLLNTAGIAVTVLFILMLITYAISITKINRKLERKTQQLQTNEDELKKLAKNLEERIKERTSELQKANQQLKKAQSVAKLGSWSLDIKKDKLKWSDEIFDIFQIDKEKFEPSYESFLNTVHPDDRDMAAKAYQNSLENKEPYSIKHRLLMNDGKVKWVQESCETQFDHKGTPLISIGTIQDITRQTEQEKLFFEQSKLASMGEMIGNIAHQWRQPLSIITTSAGGLDIKADYEDISKDDIHKFANIILKQADYLSKTIDDFKNFIKGERKKVRFDLVDNIESFLHLVDGTIKSNDIHIVKNIESKIDLTGYPNELIQCFINIFNNSKDALKSIEDERYIFLSATAADDKAIITFKDNGGGIPKDVLPRVFEPYFTTKHKSKGTGLGLSMTYNIIVKGMQGNIKVNNIIYDYKGKSFKGSEFKITLPII